jgi:AcrR family transcriptional regulator
MDEIVKTRATTRLSGSIQTMSTTAARQRREPVQERSRQTVARILDAAASLIDEAGVEAATTRAIADRAGVAYPSLYRFFADREEILDELLERHLADLDARTVAAENTWQITSAEDLIDRELDLHIAYYQEHPGAARLWLDGRTSRTVVGHVRQRSSVLADRMREALIAGRLIPMDTDPRAVLLIVELGDRILDLAFRDRLEPDRVVLDLGRAALRAYARDTLASPTR